MSIGDSFQQAADFVAASLSALSSSTESPEDAEALLANLGWLEPPVIPQALLDLQLSLRGLTEAQTVLTNARLSFFHGTGSSGAIVAALGAVVTSLSTVRADIGRLPHAFDEALAPFPEYRDSTRIAADIEKRLYDALIFEALEAMFPLPMRILALLGIVEEIEQGDAPHQPPLYILREVHWQRISKLLSDPSAVMGEVYDWGKPTLNTEKLFEKLLPLSFWFLSPAEIRTASWAFLTAIAPGGVIAEEGPEPMLELAVAAASDAVLSLGFVAAPKVTDPEPQGLGIHLIGTGTFNQTFEVATGLFFDVHADMDLVAGLGGVLRPGEGLKLYSSPDGSPASFAGGKLTGRLSRRLAVGEDPIELLSIPGGSFIDAKELFFEAGVDATLVPADIFVETGVKGGRFVYPTAGRDGFTKSLLPADGLIVDFDLSLGWSQRRGIYLRGAGGLQINLPVHQTLGPFTVDVVRLAIRADGDGLRLGAGIVGSASVGPVTATIDALGVDADLKFTSGNLGPLDLALGFAVPRGYGISIHAGPATGGGFLYFGDNRYSGALELQVYGIAVKAFGLIETKFPDGRDGFSFVMVISAEFTPIQLGFGFTLLGVGGLIGINRTLEADALGAAVRTGSLEHLLFPRNPARDAPAIINDLATIFPAAPGHYVFGPMAKLGWGTPTLITGELGIVLELPGPRLAVLGAVHMALPTVDVGIVRLNLAISGVLDFPKKLFSLDASLYDSKVAGFPISGDMAFRLNFGNQANFALAVGGFNPAFQAPAGFPKLRRVSIDLGVNGNPSLTMQGYLALTSNTAQVGAAIDLYAHGAGIELRGHLGFDALFVFSPFSFEAMFDAGVRVSFHGVGLGVHLHGTLSGPSPWRVRGEVCVSVLFWDACLGFDASFGGAVHAVLPAMDPWTGPTEVDQNQPMIGLKAAIEEPRNWSGSPPPAAFAVVTLAEGKAANPPIDPMGAATLRQKVVPLNRKLTKFGEYRPLRHDYFKLKSLSVGSEDQDIEHQLTTLQDDFAPAHFKEMSATERLSSPAYEPMDSGFTLAPNLVKVGPLAEKDVRYTTQLLGAAREPIGTPNNDFQLPRRHLLGMLQRSAAGRAGVRRTGLERYVNPTGKVKVRLGPGLFVVAGACGATVNLALTGGKSVSRTAALLALDDHLATHPEDIGKYQVLPRTEILPRPVVLP